MGRDDIQSGENQFDWERDMMHRNPQIYEEKRPLVSVTPKDRTKTGRWHHLFNQYRRVMVVKGCCPTAGVLQEDASHTVGRTECWWKESILGEGGSIPKMGPKLGIQFHRWSENKQTFSVLNGTPFIESNQNPTQMGLSKKKWVYYFTLKNPGWSWFRNDWIQIWRNDVIKIQIQVSPFFYALASFLTVSSFMVTKWSPVFQANILTG